MQNWFCSLQLKLSKPILFGICGAIGCLVAALVLGEPLLLLTRLPPAAPVIPPQSIALELFFFKVGAPAQRGLQPSFATSLLLIDCSGSMNQDNKLSEVKAAARSFVQRQDLSRNQVAVLGFGSQVHLGAPCVWNQLSEIFVVRSILSSCI